MSKVKLDNKVLMTRDIPQGPVTQVRSINFTTQLLLGLRLNLVLLVLSTNVKSGTRFAEVCF